MAIGIDENGRKQARDFEPGDSESQETVNRLTNRLKKRGGDAPEGSRLLVVRDGSKAIENVIRNWREHTNNIRRWNVKNDMMERWAAPGLPWAEGGFRRIRHYEDLPKLREALARSLAVSASSPAGAPPAGAYALT